MLNQRNEDFKFKMFSIFLIIKKKKSVNESIFRHVTMATAEYQVIYKLFPWQQLTLLIHNA